MVTMMRVLLVAVLAALVGSYCGALHPMGDSLAVLRLPLIGMAALLGLGVWRRWLRVIWVLAMWALALPVLPAVIRPAASDYDFVLYQQNLLFSRRENAAWLGAVRSARPDFVTMQEVSARNQVLLSALAADLPQQVFCPFSGVGGVAVLTRHPVVAGSETCARGLAAVQVETEHGLVWVVSIHLHWPWPFDQAEQVAELMRVLEGFQGHVIVAGDFNAVAWSHAVARIARASGTGMIGPYRASFHVYGYPLGIDHVLTGPAYAQDLAIQPKLGSDHNGVLAYLTRGAN